LGPIPNPQSPIPNPQSPFNYYSKIFFSNKIINLYRIYNLYILFIHKMSSYRRRNEINSQEIKKEPISINNKDNNSISLNIGKINNTNKSNTNKNTNNIININKNIINKVESLDKNETKILLYPQNKPRGNFPLGEIKSHNVPILYGFYEAHALHYPIRIKPDDIWLLIIQAFSNHININSEKLRHKFVNFNGKKSLTIDFEVITNIKKVIKEHYEDFIIQINNKIKNYLGKELIDILNPNFTTTDKNSTIICKLSVMNAFKKYFEYKMKIGMAICGIPYIILEGNVEDYKEILKKINFLKRYDFNWYVERIIPHINKMIEAKEGNIDTKYFKNFIQDEKITESMWGGDNCTPPQYRKKTIIKVDYIKGWFLDFFAYYGKEKKYAKMTERYIKIEDFNALADQMLVVPFKIEDKNISKLYEKKFIVGFEGCCLNNNKEVCPVSGWNISEMTKQDMENFL